MPKVMLIEDDEMMRSLLCTWLQMEGFEAIPINYGVNLTEIINAVRQEKPDLVLLDANLQKINGFDLLDHIRRDTSLKTARVIMSSGEDYRNRSIESGADGFILKPYMPEELTSMIRQMLGA